MATPGWYDDPSGGPGRKFWDGQQWHDAVPSALMTLIESAQSCSVKVLTL